LLELRADLDRARNGSTAARGNHQRRIGAFTVPFRAVERDDLQDLRARGTIRGVSLAIERSAYASAPQALKSW
jgi:hypothetical protein